MYAMILPEINLLFWCCASGAALLIRLPTGLA
jgi:hypothetical protein